MMQSAANANFSSINIKADFTYEGGSGKNQQVI
jgi:hypothetical protein